MEKFKITDGEPVEPYVFLLLDTREAVDVAKIFMTGHVKVPEDCACGDDTACHALHTKALQ